ncbi:contactin-2-like [Saccostrea echinata]|uniref:contactin-2-like n=1 Tax=Saccostrea echinata TaxID=191078 RepID=UPI002A7EC747|nr:contactin-2-like [Saccostrea echinata]
MWNEKINVFKVSSITNLQINDSTENVSPEAVYQSGYKVFIGENATLLCIFSGNPVPKVQWQNKNGTYITTNHKYIVGQYGRQLQIMNVTFDDEGVYKCIANGSLIQNPFLNVISPPIFPDAGRRFMTKIVQISTKESTVLLCNAMSLSAEIEPIVIKWMKNGKILDQDVRYQLSKDKKTLHIYNESSDAAGCYTCVIENSEGIAVSNFLLHFGIYPSKLPPEITSEFKQEYFLPRFHSSPLTLLCSAHNGEITYYWSKNDMKFNSNGRIAVNKKNGEIVFQNLTEGDFGIFYCLAENEYGTSVSLFVKISEAVLNKFPTMTFTQTCEEKQHCQLNCQDKPRCEPRNECHIEWKYGIGTSNTVYMKDKTAVDGSGNLHFLSVSKSDGNRTYGCGIWNERTKTFVKGGSIKLQIHESDARIETVPIRAVYKSRYKAVAGQYGILRCIFSGSSVPVIKWKNKNGSYIEINHRYNITENGRQLQIMNVTFDDEGEYQCIADGNISQNPFLNVTSPPKFVENNRRFLTKIVENSSSEVIILTCNAVSAPGEANPGVTKWMKNGKVINSYQDFVIQLFGNNRILQLHKEEPGYGGSYQCVVENSEGVAVANFLVHNNLVPLTTPRLAGKSPAWR